MSTMLRPLLRSSSNKLRIASPSSALLNAVKRTSTKAFATQSGDDAAKPTALARLHLEDGTSITGTSFGCHKSVEGEVREKTKRNERINQ